MDSFQHNLTWAFSLASTQRLYPEYQMPRCCPPPRTRDINRADGVFKRLYSEGHMIAGMQYVQHLAMSFLSLPVCLSPALVVLNLSLCLALPKWLESCGRCCTRAVIYLRWQAECPSPRAWTECPSICLSCVKLTEGP